MDWSALTVSGLLPLAPLSSASGTERNRSAEWRHCRFWYGGRYASELCGRTVLYKGSCQSRQPDANRSPLGALIPERFQPQAARFWHSANAAERRCL